ncbi:MAG TPA: hypothetical protein VMH33_07225 [Solirubrobacterales bacterium]|nr:hypothetical protein [Solirubrobacterales bacterium]
MRSRLEAPFLLAVIAVGCQMVWLVVPAVVLWAISRTTSSVAICLMSALIAIPAAIVALLWLLGLVDRRYLLIRNGRRVLEEDKELDWRRPGPLESILPVSVTLAIIGLVVWLVVFAAHAPSGREQFIP